MRRAISCFFWGCLTNGEWLFCSFSSIGPWKNSLPIRPALGRQLYPFTTVYRSLPFTGVPSMGAELGYTVEDITVQVNFLWWTCVVNHSQAYVSFSEGNVPLDWPQRPGKHNVSDSPQDPGVQGYLAIALICFSHAFLNILLGLAYWLPKG